MEEIKIIITLVENNMGKEGRFLLNEVFHRVENTVGNDECAHYVCCRVSRLFGLLGKSHSKTL